MVWVPAQCPFLFESIHLEVTGAEKWALGIFDRGERKMGEMRYLYSKSRSKKEIPMTVKEGMSSYNGSMMGDSAGGCTAPGKGDGEIMLII